MIPHTLPARGRCTRAGYDPGSWPPLLPPGSPSRASLVIPRSSWRSSLASWKRAPAGRVARHRATAAHRPRHRRRHRSAVHEAGPGAFLVTPSGWRGRVPGLARHHQRARPARGGGGASKAPGRRRVVCFGDSITSATGSATRRPYPYPSSGSAWRRRRGGRQRGVTGYTSHQVLGLAPAASSRPSRPTSRRSASAGTTRGRGPWTTASMRAGCGPRVRGKGSSTASRSFSTAKAAYLRSGLGGGTRERARPRVALSTTSSNLRGMVEECRPSGCGPVSSPCRAAASRRAPFRVARIPICSARPRACCGVPLLVVPALASVRTAVNAATSWTPPSLHRGQCTHAANITISCWHSA